MVGAHHEGLTAGQKREHLGPQRTLHIRALCVSIGRQQTAKHTVDMKVTVFDLRSNNMKLRQAYNARCTVNGPVFFHCHLL